MKSFQGLIYECAATSPVLHDEYRSGDQFKLKVEPKRGGEILIVCLFLKNKT